MPDFDAALAFSELFASSPPGDFLRPVYSSKPVAMPANQLSISANFDLLGTCAACDTETALAPDAFKGRKYVRLIQFWGESHNFWLDCKKLNEADWQELKEKLCMSTTHSKVDLSGKIAAQPHQSDRSKTPLPQSKSSCDYGPIEAQKDS